MKASLVIYNHHQWQLLFDSSPFRFSCSWLDPLQNSERQVTRSPLPKQSTGMGSLDDFDARSAVTPRLASENVALLTAELLAVVWTRVNHVDLTDTSSAKKK
jgi:hypothetical protein